MKISFIGAGKMAHMLAPHAIRAGHQVVVSNSRGPETLQDFVAELGSGASAATVADAVEGADIVVLATPWGKIKDALAAVPSWNGRVLIDPTNNRTKPGPDGLIDIGGIGSSAYVSALVPGAKVVKTLNYEPIPIFDAGISQDGPKAVFLGGDDDGAKATVTQFFKDIGVEAIDVGNLECADKLLMGGGALALSMRVVTPEEGRARLAEAQA